MLTTSEQLGHRAKKKGKIGMGIMSMLTARMVTLFIIGAVGQAGGSLLLGRTAGFTQVPWSLACAGVYAVSFWALSTLIREGGPLSLIMPLLAAIVPLAVSIIAIVAMGESASTLRVSLLVVACLTIGVAGAV